MNKQITITIKNGKIHTDLSGFQGQECDRMAEKIHPDELEVEDKELKPEYQFENETDSDFNTF